MFITTTFGGFGSAVIYELSDYYSVKIRNYRLLNKVKVAFTSKVIAFPLQSISVLRNVPQTILNSYSMNEIEFVNEFRNKTARNNKWYQELSNCIPYVELYVPVVPDTNKLYKCLGMKDDDLQTIDIKEQYYITPASRKPQRRFY